MAYAICVTLCKSSAAPVEIFPTRSSSAARPPKLTAILSKITSFEKRLISLGRYWAKPSAPLDRGTMDTFSKGSECSRNQPTIACPDSCMATDRRSSLLIKLFCFGRPPITRSVACSKSCISTLPAFRRAAKMAASLQMFAMSLPTKPGVRAAMRLAMLEASRSSDNCTGFRWTVKMDSRSAKSGLSMAICLSRRPGRIRAGSKMSTRFVPARTTTPVPEEKPSISTSIWLRVFSLSSLLPLLNPPCPRLRPMASISSMKMMEGAVDRACWKRSRMRAAPTPTNISTNSEPLME
mmetsp:Transcript_84434/g.243736  ORF Transcript_84434/g.243736 Transcript_84434/m.243736 type:complete len:294 (+) Transcript_84434:945-1826(+)